VESEEFLSRTNFILHSFYARCGLACISRESESPRVRIPMKKKRFIVLNLL
jgi:hypothetical protein